MSMLILWLSSLTLLLPMVESEVPTIEVELSNQVPRVGDNVTFTCLVNGLDGNTVTIHKVVTQLEGKFLTEQIAINDDLNRLYVNLKRYSIVKTTDGSNQRFTLRITGVQFEDSGNYGCAVTKLDDLYALKVLEVYRKPTNISFLNVNQSIVVVRENQMPNFVCLVPDVLPIPSVRIWLERELIGPKDITDDFVVSSRQNIKCSQGPSEKSCPLHLSYTMEATNRKLNISFFHDERTLTCTTKMKTLDEDEMRTEITLKVLYAPKFVCAGIWNTTLNSTNLEIQCLVYANPPSDRFNKSVSIKEIGRFVLVKPGEDTDLYSLEDTVMPSTEEKTTALVFTIKTVTEEHFNYTYTFYAVNSEGKTTKTIRIEKSLTPIVDGAEGAMKRGSRFLLLVFLFVFLSSSY